MCWHSWGKWKQYMWLYVRKHVLTGVQLSEAAGCTEIREQRVCTSCGAMQDRLVNENGRIVEVDDA